MMIQKLRQLGLGLFPAEKETEREQDDASLLSHVSSNEIDCSCTPSPYRRSSRKSYAIELFEAACRKIPETRETSRDESPCPKPNRELVLASPVVEEDRKELCIVKHKDLVFHDREDSIKAVQKSRKFPSVKSSAAVACYLIIIPKRIMVKMPRPPNSFVAPPSVPNFYIRALMVEMSDEDSVNAAVDWLLSDGEDSQGCILGLDCQLGIDRALNLIQLSLHQRCILIRLSNSSATQNPEKLVNLMSTHKVIKTGVDIREDALAIYWATGMIVNAFMDISEVHIFRQRPLNMMAIFRNLYDWVWSSPKEISTSDWGRAELSSRQIKYSIMNVWSSRMIALEGAAVVDGAVTLMALNKIPSQVLDLFGRALAETYRSEEPVLQETSGVLSETAEPGTLQLEQHSFRSRVKGKCAIVEMHLKEDQGSAHYKIKSRKGKCVLLAPCPKPSRNIKKKDPEFSSKPSCGQEVLPKVSIESITGLTVVDRAKQQSNWQSRHLWEGLKSIICNPAACPKHLLLALGYNTQYGSKSQKPIGMAVVDQFGGRHACQGSVSSSKTRSLDLSSKRTSQISGHLNESQREAWEEILTSPLSATIGPPGTGKTSLITAVTNSWIATRKDGRSKEILLCCACQNVAVRHLAETLVRHVPGVLLLISEDYYSGWHEDSYAHLAKSLVVSSSDQCELGLNLAAWRADNEGMEFPNVVVCTVDLVGCPSFVKSLMAGKVTAMIIDESSQASDLSILRPFVSLPHLAMVSVLGDPHQLPPFTASRGEQSMPSVFDLVSKSCKINFLREQYRMPAIICDFLSVEIYDNMLKTAPHRSQEIDSRPLIWSHVRGIGTSDTGKTSLYNLAEANAIFSFCEMLVRKKGVPCERVVVLTLYEEQTRRISEMLAGSHLDISVHNVDSFQGQECDIVLISIVAGRSFSPFAADQRRACVMLSRVKRMLCVFGDFDEVKRSQQAGLWMKLATYCKKRNLVVDRDKMDSFLGTSLNSGQQEGPQTRKVSWKEFPSNDTPTVTAGIPVQVMFKAR